MSRTISLTPMHDGQRLIYANRSKRNVIRCGRRWGKTTAFMKWAASWALEGKSVGFFAPNYKLLRPSYDALLRTLRPIVQSASKLDALIELKTGGAIEFWTLNDPDAGRSRRYHHALIDEASLAQNLQDIYEKAIAPTLLDFDGSAWLAATPKGTDESNFFYQTCHNPEKWREFWAPTRSNPCLNPMAVAQLKADNHPLVFEQEYEAQFVSWAGEAFFSLDKLTIDGKGVPIPQHVDYVFAVIDSAMKAGLEHDGTAVIWCAKSSHGNSAPLTILDYDVIQVDSDLLITWLPSVIERAEYFARACSASGSVGIWLEDKGSGTTLLQHGARNGWPVNAIDSTLVQGGKDNRAIAASSPVWRGEVKLSQEALDKTVKFKNVTKNHLVSQITNFIVGDPAASKRADDLSDCFTYSVILALNGPDGY